MTELSLGLRTEHLELENPRFATGQGWGGAVFGLAAMLLGGVELWSGRFATIWQPVPDALAGPGVLAYAVAAVFIAAGIGLQFNGTRRVAALILALIYATFALLWSRRILAHPGIVATWAGAAEQGALVVAATLLFAGARSGRASPGLVVGCRLSFGLCALMYGWLHFANIDATAAMVPSWLIPGQPFWAVATGLADVAAGLAMLSGVMAALAARLLTVMFASFALLVWLPILIRAPSDHLSWAGNGVNLALVGAAWVLADALARDPATRLMR